jgi:hypothetical protein
MTVEKSIQDVEQASEVSISLDIAPCWTNWGGDLRLCEN